MAEQLRCAVFHPLTVWGSATLATLGFIALMWPRAQFAGEGRFYLLVYHAPIAFAFVVYGFDRLSHQPHWRLSLLMIDGVVIALALIRAFVAVPFISGHALFLTYTLLTAYSPRLRWVSLAVLVDVVAIKWLLHDATLFGGALVGAVAGWAQWRWRG